MTAPRPVTGPDGDNPISDEQIDAVERDAIRDEDDALAKECRITRIGSASKARIALARARCAAAYNARHAGKE